MHDRRSITSTPIHCLTFFGLAVLLVMLIAVMLKPQATTNTPSAVLFDPPSLELGDVWLGQPIPQVAKMQNLSENEMTVVDVRESCRCIKVGDLKFPLVVAPGNEVQIPLSFDFSGFARRLATQGTIDLDVALLVVRDKPLGKDIMNIRGVLHSPIAASSAIVPIGESIVQGQPSDEEFKTTFTVAERFVFSEAIYDRDRFFVDCYKTQSGAYEMSVRIRESMPAGPVDEKVNIVCKDARTHAESSFPFVLEGMIQQEFFTMPPELQVGICAPLETVLKELIVYSRSEHPFTIHEVVCDSNELSASVAESSSDGTWQRLSVIVKPAEAGVFSDLIRIKIKSHQDQYKELAVKVLGTAIERDGVAKDSD